MSNRIVVEFSGYMEVDLERTMFVRVTDSRIREFITGSQWLALDPELKEEYCIFDMEHALSDAWEVGWNHADIVVRDDDGREIYSDRTYS